MSNLDDPRVLDPDTYAQKIAYSQWLGIVVIVFGMLVNFASILQYRRGLISLRPPEFIEGYYTQYPVWLNLFTAFSGLLLIISFWLH